MGNLFLFRRKLFCKNFPFGKERWGMSDVRTVMENKQAAVSKSILTQPLLLRTIPYSYFCKILTISDITPWW